MSLPNDVVQGRTSEEAIPDPRPRQFFVSPSITVLLSIYTLVVLSLLSPLASHEYFPSVIDLHDHLAFIMQAKLALAQGEFPLRITARLNEMYGYPLFQFYNPTLYTLAGLIHLWLSPDNPYIAFKIMQGCSIIFAALYSYKLILWLFRSPAIAYLSGIFYISAPYYFINMNYRGSFAETVAQGMIPCVLYYSFRVYQKFTLREGCILAFLWYLLATLHLITVVNIALFSLLFFFIYAPRSYLRWLSLIGVGIGGVLLACWFIAPLGLTSTESYRELNDPFLYSWLTPLAGLISPTAAPILAPPKITFAMVIPPISIGWPLLLTAGATAYAFFTRQIPIAQRALIRTALIFFAFVFFIIWTPFNFWSDLPKLLTISQFSYRLISQCMWVGLILFAAALQWLFKEEEFSFATLMIGTFILILSTSSWMSTFPILNNVINPLHTDSYVYNPPPYPPVAPENPYNLPLPTALLSAADTRPFCDPYGSTTTCRLFIPKNISLTALPVLYYPKLLRVRVNNKEVPYTGVPAHALYPYAYESYYVVAVKPQPGIENTIEITFTGLRWANGVSRMAWAMLLFLFLYSYRKRHG